jgi:hypothetical protein
MARTSVLRWLGTALLAAGLAITTASPASGTADAPRNIADLSAAVARLDGSADTRPASVTGWYVDLARRTLVVSVHGSAAGVPGWAAEHGAGAIEVEHVAEAPRPFWDLISGQLIQNGSARCTLGFNAFSGASRFILTAGHCVTVAGSWYGAGGYIGESGGSSFPGNDFGFITVQSAAAESTPLVDRYSSGSDVTITGATNPTVGMSVCSSSPVTGWKCGSITGINQTVCYPEGCVTGMARSNMCSEPGTSGAPVVTNPGSGTTVRAVGFISGGSGNCSSGGTTWIQPVAEPLATYGMTLYTG